jgi:hypothetical protein
VIHTDVLRFRGARYLWWAIALTMGSILLYGSHRGLRPPSGDSWQGYLLGTVGALLIGWLALLAIRKRRYASTMGTVQGWTSAHVYLGTALVIVATLHCAFQFGWNVHTLAYVLMCLVIASGFFGVARYTSSPKQMAENRQGMSRAEMFAELLDVDRKARSVAEGCSPAVQTAVASSIERTTIGGGVWAQLAGRDQSRFLRMDEASGTTRLSNNVDQEAVIAFVADRIPRASKSEETARLQQLLVLLCRRQVLVRRLRRDIRLQGWLKVWLYFHVRMTAALFVALGVHIVTTFLYR